MVSAYLATSFDLLLMSFALVGKHIMRLRGAHNITCASVWMLFIEHCYQRLANTKLGDRVFGFIKTPFRDSFSAVCLITFPVGSGKMPSKACCFQNPKLRQHRCRNIHRVLGAEEYADPLLNGSKVWWFLSAEPVRRWHPGISRWYHQ